jgi:hypothetical protein
MLDWAVFVTASLIAVEVAVVVDSIYGSAVALFLRQC